MATLQQAIPSQDLSTLSPAEARGLFNSISIRYLKMTGEEFLSKLASGYFEEHPELAHKVDLVRFYLPLLHTT